MNTKGINITGKDIGFVLTILVMIVGFFVKFEVMKNQVEENTKTLTDHNLELIAYKIDDLDKKMDQAIELLLAQ